MFVWFNVFVLTQHYILYCSLYRVNYARARLSLLLGSEYHNDSMEYGQILAIFICFQYRTMSADGCYQAPFIAVEDVSESKPEQRK
jgi:hypothetical protein